MSDATTDQKPPVREIPVFRHIRRFFADYVPSVIFDVGANVGQSCLSYAQAFPTTRIHAFEPVPGTFDTLKAKVANIESITPWNIALSSSNGTATMRRAKASVGDRIVQDGAEPDGETVEVKTMTGTAFCQEHEIDRISFLKIDTEGHDLDVLKGFLGMLDRVAFVQVEAAMNRYNKSHVQFSVFMDFMEARNFHLLHLYEQRLEFKLGGRPILRRADPVFINGALVDLTGLK